MALDVRQPKGYRKAWNGSPRTSTREELIARLRDYLASSALGYSERFEQNAERFYRETGYMAPGKSVPLEMGGSGMFSDEQRGEAWDTWNELNREQWKQDMRDVIAALEEPK
jgi:hypothetical protein